MRPRAVIAGAGLMGYWHAKAIEYSGGEVTAVVDRNREAAQRLANHFKKASVHTGLAELLSREKIDVLHVCTPLESHFELAATALDQGIHVLAEKPLTSTAEETRRLYDIANARRAILCPVHQFPFQRGMRNAADALGSIGTLRHFEARFCSAGGAGKSGTALDAIVLDILPHPLSLMQLIVPGSLSDGGWNIIRPTAGELHAMTVVGDVSFSILVSMSGRPTSTSLRLIGTSGTIHVDLFHGFSVTESGEVSRWRKIMHPFDLSARTLCAASANLLSRALKRESAYPGLRPLIQSFYTSIAKGGSAPICSEDAIAIAGIRDFFATSSRVK